ncbi:porin family protein [Pontibacter oryzae]|uniref:PorT family protein n=1 Tax=Pontibacter oryzae TaxID=2304593 RepID=A0A399RSC2_9BACT|nr:porin family protein [Pontibacter oryzae]RIJ34008.1 PorT family protein [Pontibacter oryzae]
MKHLILACFLLAFAVPVFGQDEPHLRIGAKVGINFYQLSSDDLVMDDDTGLSSEYSVYGRIGETFFVQPELNFVNHKTHLITRNQTTPNERDALLVRYLRVPVYLGYQTGYDGPIISRVRFMAGPSYSFALSVADNNIDIERKDIHNSQFALNGGLAFEVWVLHLDLLYHHYITSLLNDGRSEGKGRAFSVAAGINF